MYFNNKHKQSQVLRQKKKKHTENTVFLAFKVGSRKGDDGCVGGATADG